MTTQELYNAIICKPDLMIDDGGDFIALLHGDDMINKKAVIE